MFIESLVFTFSLDDDDDQVGAGAFGLTEQTITLWLQGIFVFSLIWSLGTALPLQHRVRFSEVLRELLSGQNPLYERPPTVKFAKSNSIPERLTVYDFVFERKATGSWMEWSSKLSIPELGKEERPEDMIVPTAETVRMSYFLDIYLSHRVPMLIVGHTGKSNSHFMKGHSL